MNALELLEKKIAAVEKDREYFHNLWVQSSGAYAKLLELKQEFLAPEPEEAPIEKEEPKG